MPTPYTASDLQSIGRFDQLLKYLRDELDWPIDSMDIDDLTFDYTADELGLKPEEAVKVKAIKQLRPMTGKQPWGIFFVDFAPKTLPIVVLRRILSRLAIRKRASASASERPSWNLHDLLFISSYGDADHRNLTFAHFAHDPAHTDDLPVLRVLGWDDQDTVLHLDHAHETLKAKLHWPEDPSAAGQWRAEWGSAFTLRLNYSIRTSKELAQTLADLASAIRKRVNRVLAIESDKGTLRQLMTSFREALIHDLEEDGFADMYAQTIAYGLLTARISRRSPDDDHGALVAENLTDMVPITNPFLKELLETFLKAGGRKGKLDFDELGVNDVVEMLRQVDMDAVLRDFGNRNPQEDPVIHFYELFLKEYDAKKRMQRGVFYTPRPVVSYIVRSVHELLQTEFGLEDGLASTATWSDMLNKHPEMKLPLRRNKNPNAKDQSEESIDPATPFVQILDPATGTATFLVEAIDIIHKTMLAKWKKHGHTEMFDIPKLWNDYVPTHLLPRLHGYELMMAPYAIAHMKIGLKLFETGYRFASQERARIYLTNALEPAQDFADHLAQMAPALAHEAEAVNAVKRHQRFTVVIGNPPYSLYSANLTDAAAALIARYRSIDGEMIRERGALQLEKNLQDDYVKFFGLTQSIIDQAGTGILGFISNHGYLNNRTLRGLRHSMMEKFKYVVIADLRGSASRSSGEEIDQNVFDIQQGVAVGVFVKNARSAPSIGFVDVSGTRDAKYKWLLSHTAASVPARQVVPSAPLFLFEPRDCDTEQEYLAGLALDEIFPANSTGIVTARDALVVRFTRAEIVTLLDQFSGMSAERARTEYSLGPDTKDWAVDRAQRDVRDGLRRKLQPIQMWYRPFDVRWTFYTGQARGFMCNPRRPVMAGLLNGENLALCANRQVNTDFRHVGITRGLVTDCTLSTATKERTYVFPLYVNADETLLSEKRPQLNLSPCFIELLEKRYSGNGAASIYHSQHVAPKAVLSYVYGLLHSPSYRDRYRDFLRSDFPRIPLSCGVALFKELSRLGSELISLHLLESPPLERPITTYTGPDEPEVEKGSYADGTVWLDRNQTCGFVGVPEAVWNFHIGGYQVCEKWLKDRKGRTLTKDDLAHYQKIVVALNETIRLMKEIDGTIEKHGGWPGAFVTSPAKPA